MAIVLPHVHKSALEKLWKLQENVSEIDNLFRDNENLGDGRRASESINRH